MEKFEKLMDRNFTPVEWKLGSFEVRSNRTKERVQVCLLSCVLIGWKIVCVKLLFYWVVTVCVAPFVYPSRPIKSCRRERVMSMDVFWQCETPLWIDMDPYGDYMKCLWAFSGIVRTPLLYSPLDQSNLVGTYVHFLWPFSGIVYHGSIPYIHVLFLWTFSRHCSDR